MTDTLSRHFGLIIAYVLPGFIGLAGIALLAPAVGDWLRPVNQGELSVGPAVYVILAATTVGMIVSCFRWLIIDHFHHWMGVIRPAWDDSRLEEHLGAFNYLVEVHYRYYQSYANMIVAIVLAYAPNRIMEWLPFLSAGTDAGVLILCTVLFLGSRDALLNYYAGTARLLSHTAEKGFTGDAMTNGRGHESVGCVSPSAGRPQNKSQVKSETPAKPQPPKAGDAKTEK
jgi:hypothetical protein